MPYAGSSHANHTPLGGFAELHQERMLHRDGATDGYERLKDMRQEVKEIVTDL